MFVRSGNKQRIPTRPQAAADANAMRAHNTSLLLHLIWHEEKPSRADLARDTGLSRSTVSAIVGELMELGVVEESHVEQSRGGRPPIALSIVEDHHHIFGVELGSSHITVVRMDLRGTVVDTRRQAFPVAEQPGPSLDRLCALMDELTAAHPSPVLAIGLAVASPLDPARPGLLSERILPAWKGVQPAQVVEEHTGLPVFMDNDANMGALAESWWGAGQGVGDFAFIKVATGVGAGLIIDGRIYQGASGIAGEIGHTAIDPKGPRCRCGLYGCLEAMVGTPLPRGPSQGVPPGRRRLHAGSRRPRHRLHHRGGTGR